MLKVGIVGAGLIAEEHARAIGSVPGMTLTAVADVSAERLRGFAEKFQVSRRYARAEDLIADSEVDLVAIATPPSFHEEAAIAALEAGKYVLCEKPLAHAPASAARIMSAESRHPGRLAVSHQLRYDPAWRRLIWLCQNGWIGDIESARLERHGYIPHMRAGQGGWWGAWNVAGGGVLITQLIHEIDLLLLVMGRPVSVSAEMDTRYTAIDSEDWIEVDIRFAGGGMARCTASVNSGQMRGGMVVKGSLGTAFPAGLALADLRRQAQALKAVDRALPDTAPPSSSLPSRGLRKLSRRLGVMPAHPLSAHALLYREIGQCISRSMPLPIGPAEAFSSLQVCAAAYESALTGKPVELPLAPGAISYNGISKAAYDARPQRPRAAMARVALAPSRSVRIGLIGLDTTHAPTFTDLLHNPYHPDHIPGAKVVAAFPGGSPDMPISSSRVGGFTAQLRDTYGVPILDAPEAVADRADLVFILSADGRLHRGLFQSVAGRGKPVFVDKPFAVSAADAEAMMAIAERTGTRVFASSAFRYADGLVSAMNAIRAAGERIRSCRVRYWQQMQETQGRYFWYGIHGAEMLLAIMGKGIDTVEVASAGETDTITVLHQDGRRSSLIGAQNDGAFAVSIETEKRVVEVDLGPSMASISARILASALDVLTEGRYPRLWRASTAGSVVGRPGRSLDPTLADTLEIVRLLDAAQRSYASGRKTPIREPAEAVA